MNLNADTARHAANLIQELLDLDPYSVLLRPAYREGFVLAKTSIEKRLAKGQFPEVDPSVFKPEVL